MKLSPLVLSLIALTLTACSPLSSDETAKREELKVKFTDACQLNRQASLDRDVAEHAAHMADFSDESKKVVSEAQSRIDISRSTLQDVIRARDTIDDNHWNLLYTRWICHNKGQSPVHISN